MLKSISILAPFVLALWVSLPNFNYSNVEKLNDFSKMNMEFALYQQDTSSLPYWPSWLPTNLINLGLDLRGGAQVLVEVILSDAYTESIANYCVDIRKVLRSDRPKIGAFRRMGELNETLVVRFDNSDKAQLAKDLINT